MNNLLIKRPNLSKAQKPLFDLICKKLGNNQKLTLPEVKDIYLNYSCRDVRDGIPYYYEYCKSYDHKENKCIGGYSPMPIKYADMLTTMWLMHNIGALVLKGYLKVIPILELNS